MQVLLIDYVKCKYSTNDFTIEIISLLYLFLYFSHFNFKKEYLPRTYTLSIQYLYTNQNLFISKSFWTIVFILIVFS